MLIFPRREMAETAYRLRRAVDRSADLAGDEASLRLRAIVAEPCATRVDRSYVETICAQIEVPLTFIHRDARGRIVPAKRLIERLGDDDVLPYVCLWAFVWWATFNERVPTWGITAMRPLWRHGGGAIRDRFTSDEIARAKRRILGRLSA